MEPAPAQRASAEPNSAPGGAVDPQTWVQRYGDLLFGYALLRVRDRTVAEELVQECFVAALEAKDRFLGGSTEQTWLVGILKHKLLDHLRRRSRQPASADQDAGLEDFDKRGLWRVRVNAWSDDPQARLENEAFRNALNGCIGGLPNTHAVAFILREIDGMQSEEICTLLEISPTNLWARLHRARLGLRRCLESKWFQR
ncbi:MAG TPA: sigma-70 family RNA polymerase sigma factor [Phycisphaerae bacterium]|nr:sigma-70 family RNA polymerase sigma factor [Phycisphaerales bacterium]HRX85455.1 sigma-70 family RNA polymerase sigma factor [Phycisphaerae bacterium]